MNELQEVIERTTLDRPAAKTSLAVLEREREELRKKIGTVDVAVDLVRDARDQ